MKSGNGPKALQVIRWIARVAAGPAAAVILLFFIGEVLAEGLAPLLRMSARESAMMVAFTAVWLGLVLGWRWELLGGLFTVGGLAAFYLLDYAFSGTFPRGPYFFLFASPGLLFLICGLWARTSRARQRGSPRDRTVRF